MDLGPYYPIIFSMAVEDNLLWCSTSLDCQDRFKCYPLIDNVDRYEDKSGHCLCNRLFLFHGGQDCGHNSPVAFFSLTYIAVMNILACFEYLPLLYRLHSEAGASARRSSTLVFVTGFANFFALLSIAAINCTNLAHLWVFPGHWYEVSGFVLLLNASCTFLAVANLSICVEFYRKLATVNVLSSYFVQRMKWLIASIQAAVFLVVIYSVSTGLPLEYVLFLLSAPSFVIAFAIFTAASGKLSVFLVQHQAQQLSNDTLLQGILSLSKFSNQFRFWLLFLFFMFSIGFPLDIQTKVPAIVPHLVFVANMRICIQFARIMFCFCLPPTSSRPSGPAVVLINPEERFWEILLQVNRYLQSINSQHASSSHFSPSNSVNRLGSSLQVPRTAPKDRVSTSSNFAFCQVKNGCSNTNNSGSTPCSGNHPARVRPCLFPPRSRRQNRIAPKG